MALMTSDADTVALLERALDQTAGLIAAIEPGLDVAGGELSRASSSVG